MTGSSWLAGGVRVLLWSVVATARAADGNALPSEAWPAAGDFTTVAWLDGFPGRAVGAPWERCIRTGRYAFVLNTEAITVPHLGKIKAEPYGVAVRSPEVAITGLPAADLALLMEVDGRVFHCSGGRNWDGIAGPRLIESGQWVQRNDVDGLTFHSKNGLPLNVNARLEAVAWPDRLALIFAAQPGYEPIPTGTACFGRVGGGFGLNGTNEFTVSPDRMIDPARFTFECWVYAPPGYDAATNAVPWLVCKGHHEQVDGNYGITLQGGVPHGRLNIGGGRDQAFSVSAGRRLTLEAWNHVALTYDGRAFTIFLNGRRGGEVKIGRERVATTQPLIVGRRGDNSGDGYHFKGAIDEVAIYERPLTAAEIHDRFHVPEKPLAAGPATFIESFDPEGEPRSTRMRTRWRKGSMAIRLGSGGHVFQQRCDLPGDAAASDWHEVAVAFDPANLLPAVEPVIMVEATPVTVDPHQPPPTLPVRFDAVRGWHCIDLNRVEPTLPPEVNRGQTVVVGKEDVLRDPRNDVLDRVRLVLTNSSNHEQAARLCFEKTKFAGSRVGSPITGLSAILRDASGQPTGIPVQLSKNWHRGRGGSPYDGQWFHGFTQVRVPAKSTMQLELVMAYGHWGGVPAASHAQLSLLGWGQNQLWEESAIGSWGESICYEPDQVHAGAAILDVRPLLVRSLPDGRPWQWTGNVGGGDFFRIEAADGSRLWRRNMKVEYVRPGPCLTEVTYAGQLGSRIDHAETVSLGRTDDIVRGTYRLRMDVHRPVNFSRFVVFQIGADTYSHAAAKKIAVGTAAGLTQEWDAAWAGNASTTLPAVCAGTTPWVSLLGTASDGDGKPIGSRGFVIRKWRAVLGGREAEPWITEHGTPSTSRPSATVDIVPPPGVTRLEPGDFVEATIELLVLPLSAAEYYGPNEALRVALRDMASSWQMVHREAVGNDRHVSMKRGDFKHAYPDIRVTVDDGTAEFALHGGLGYVPLTFTGLASHRAGELRLDGKLVDQSVHGGDFWQTDYDPVTQTWSHTFTVARPGTTPANGQPVNVFYQQKSQL